VKEGTSYSSLYRRRKRAGDDTSISAAEVRRHIRRLHDAGLTNHAIAKAAGCSPSTISNVMCGRSKRMWRDTGGAILGVTIDAAVASDDRLSKVPAWRTQRLIAEMKRAGMTNAELSDILRRTHKRGLTNIIGPERVAAVTQDRFVAIYRYLAEQGRVPRGVLEDIA
jgi:IS30 family transposase